MWLKWDFQIDKNIVQINYNKNIWLFSQNLINITLEIDQNIKKSKKHYLILKMNILSLKNYLLFIAFFYSYLMVNIY